jgi:hypothetical protein
VTSDVMIKINNNKVKSGRSKGEAQEVVVGKIDRSNRAGGHEAFTYECEHSRVPIRRGREVGHEDRPARVCDSAEGGVPVRVFIGATGNKITPPGFLNNDAICRCGL